MQRCLLRHASMKLGFSATVSERALNVLRPNVVSLAQCGIKPNWPDVKANIQGKLRTKIAQQAFRFSYRFVVTAHGHTFR